MKYIKTEHFAEKENMSVLGVGMGNMQDTSAKEIEAIIRRAIEGGINLFDLCAGGKNVFRPVAKAIAGVRDKLILQLHFGAGFDEMGEYEWIREFDRIRDTFDWHLRQLKTDYADVGILHCVDDMEDMKSLRDDGVLDLMKELKQKGRLRHLGFSTDTPAVAEALIELGIFDIAMLPVNPVDVRKDESGFKTVADKCREMGVTVIAMRVFGGGALLDADKAPDGRAMTCDECLGYALETYGAAAAVTGVRSLAELEGVLAYGKSDVRKYEHGKQLSCACC